MSEQRKIKILLTGGGSGGSVTPLLALYDELKERGLNQGVEYEFLWLGTRGGIEREMVEAEHIAYRAISAGKLRRYFSWCNLLDPYFILKGFFESCRIIKKWQPDLVVNAGSFVGVPVAYAARWRKVPVVTHQQDARPGLANKLTRGLAEKITVSLEKSVSDYGSKAVWTGNPVRLSFVEAVRRKTDKQAALDSFKLNSDLPVVLFVGGGTGALALNMLVVQSISELAKFCQVIHVTGHDKDASMPFRWKYDLNADNYRQFEFLNSREMLMAYLASDLVVSRCGMNALTELSYLGKPAILIPIPNSHQVDNAEAFLKADAAVSLYQSTLTAERLVESIHKTLRDPALRERLSANIRKMTKKDANERMVEVIGGILNQNGK